MPPLRRGEVVEGRIVRAVSPHHAILLIKGKQLVARTPHALKDDAVVFFKVDQIAPEYVLKLMEVSPDSPGGLSSLIRIGDIDGKLYQSLIESIDPSKPSSQIASNQRLPGVIRQIWHLMRRISLAPDRRPDPQFLQSLMEGSGLVWENKLMKALLFAGLAGRNQAQALLRQDLKGLALAALKDETTHGLISSEGLSRFVDSLEQFQLANLIGLEEKGKAMLVIPMQWGDSFRFAQLLIDLPNDDHQVNGRDEKPLTLSLFLDMSRLGPIRVDCSVVDRAIRVCFLVCSEKIQVFLDGLTSDLKNQLERHGFSVRQITCRFEKKEILEKTSFVDALVDVEHHRVSVLI
jgi:hypothetical protein